MIYIIIALSSFLVAGLTFFSGFGLGTLLLPLFAVLFPIPVAVAAVAIVHLMNNISKVVLVGKHAHWGIVMKFGIPAVIAAFGGAWSLMYLSDMQPLYQYTIGGRIMEIFPVKLTIGSVMIVFAIFELTSAKKKLQVPSTWIPLGGVLSGFFGGLSGHQGALRTLFLTRAGLSKEALIGTVAFIGASVDIMRLFVYGTQRLSQMDSDVAIFVGIATVSAWFGSFIGSRLLQKITLRTVKIMIGCMLLVLGCALAAGIV
ncbi:TSUP family transporter [Candidatus Latescibacterota bacterium]